jgi:hypothetical protein
MSLTSEFFLFSLALYLISRYPRFGNWDLPAFAKIAELLKELLTAARQ